MRKRYFFFVLSRALEKGEHSEFHWGINFRSSDSAQLSHRDSMVSQAITKSRVTYATDWFKTTHMLKRICFWCYWLDVDPYPLRQCLIKITTLDYFCKSFILPQPFCPVYPESEKKSGIFHVTFHHLRLLPRTDKGKFLFLKLMVPLLWLVSVFVFVFFLILLFSLTGLWKAAVDFPCKWLSTSSSQC